ncbi:hypothetical protein ACFWR9_12010 [Streptomyces sp. NPDC058534]|uniref:hypothetical protein n=1 Tax=Streptomyces sp. NPDC058534 TaxID=3346541 RepID=UPI003654DAA1
MNGSLRGPTQHAGTRDFDADPQVTVSGLGHAAGRCPSLYDAIRKMRAHGSAMEAEKHRVNVAR